MRRPVSWAHNLTADPSPDNTLLSSNCKTSVPAKPQATPATSASVHLWHSTTGHQGGVKSGTECSCVLTVAIHDSTVQYSTAQVNWHACPPARAQLRASAQPLDSLCRPVSWGWCPKETVICTAPKEGPACQFTQGPVNMVAGICVHAVLMTQ